MVIMYFKKTIGNLILIDKLFLTLTEQGTYWCGRPYFAFYIFFLFKWYLDVSQKINIIIVCQHKTILSKKKYLKY